MKLNLLYLFYFIYLTCFSQGNLNEYIYNPSFEIYDTCPQSPSAPGIFQINHCLGWYAPTPGTSDYFNSCNNVSGLYNVGVPTNYFGNQTAYNGVAYTGLYAYSLNGDGTPCRYTEYIQTKLASPLKSGVKYHLEFYTSLAETSTGAIKHIGAYFSVDNIVLTGIYACPYTYNPQIQSDSAFLQDSLNWMKIEGSFIAEGGEEYLTIGNFEVIPQEILPLKPDSVTFGDYYVYYYIDGISFYEDNTITFPNVVTINGDGINDKINLYSIFGKSLKSFSLFNRWGNEIFQTNDPKTIWSGTDANGDKLSDGVYFYKISYGNNSFKKNINGFIQLFNH